jgi:hypothetical protein
MHAVDAAAAFEKAIASRGTELCSDEYALFPLSRLNPINKRNLLHQDDRLHTLSALSRYVG